MTAQVKITIQQLINALLDEDKPIHPRYLYRLSDITPEDLEVLKKAWPSVAAWRRQAIMEDLEEVGEDNYTLSFEGVALLGANDPEPRVRASWLYVSCGNTNCPNWSIYSCKKSITTRITMCALSRRPLWASTSISAKSKRFPKKHCTKLKTGFSKLSPATDHCFCVAGLWNHWGFPAEKKCPG